MATKNSLLHLIFLPGIFVTSNFLFTPPPAYSYCVYNRTDFEISGTDKKRTNLLSGSFDLRGWQANIKKGERDCCPGDNSECTDPELEIQVKGFTCTKKIGTRDWLVVRSISKDGKTEFSCIKNGKT